MARFRGGLLRPHRDFARAFIDENVIFTDN